MWIWRARGGGTYQAAEFERPQFVLNKYGLGTIGSRCAGQGRQPRVREIRIKPLATSVGDAQRGDLARSGCGGPELGVPGGERGVAAARDDQVSVPARLDDPAAVEHDDLVRVANRGEPVCDRDRRPS